MVKKLVFLILFAMLLGACSSTGSADDVEAAVRTAFQEYGDSLEAADADRWGDLWTEDGIQYPPDTQPLVGKEALVADLRTALEVITISDMQINVEEVQVASDWAYARGTYSYMLGLLPDDGSDPAFIEGKYMSIFQKQDDGSWKLHRDVYNYNSAE